MIDSGIKWIGSIPDDWELKKIKFVLQSRNENNNPIKSRDILSLTAKQGVIPLEEKEGGGNKPKEDYSAYKLAYPNDIVMNSMNVLSGSVGLSKYFGCVSPVYYMLRPLRKEDDVRYFNYIFQTTAFQKNLLGLGNGILIKESGNGKYNTIRMRIPLDKLGNLYIPVPNSKLQKRLSDFLDSIVPEIDELLLDIEKEIETLEEYKKSIITEAVTKGIDSDSERKNSGIDWIDCVPNNWKIIKGKYIFSQRNQFGNTKNLELLSPTQKYGVIPQKLYEDITGMVAVKLSEKTNLSKLKTIHKGDFCISLRSFQGGFEYSNYEGVVSPAYQVFYPSVEIADGYYKYLFKERSFIEKMNSYTLTLRDGKMISFADFGNTYVPYPDIEEQKHIAEYLDNKCTEIDALILEKKEELETLSKYKKSIIYEYVTGKKEVN